MELKQHLRLTQQLVMTPQLQQAIKLLQLSRFELLNTIKQEMETNPILEDENEIELTEISIIQSGEEKEETRKLEELVEIWEQYTQDVYLKEGGVYEREEKEEATWENLVTKGPSLTEHLLWQLRLSDMTEKEKYIARFIIGNLNEDGYLRSSLEELALQTETTAQEVEKVLKKVQEFDPIGVAARDLKECLLLQVKYFKIDNPLVETIINDYLPFLEKRDLKGIARSLKLPIEEIKKAVELILHLEPKPGRQYSSENPIYIIPDVYVYKVENDFVIVLNEESLPKLRINKYYQKLMSEDNLPDKVRVFLHNKFKSATWLLKSIHQRQRTLYRVAYSIFKFQRDFLEKGIEHLRPLILKDVADDLGIHESTVSRVTTNKYVQTPHGLFELKFFFNAGINDVSGSFLAVESIKAKIKEIIASENPKKPYSDEKIAAILKEKGINIARRTVAKYRETMGILSSNQRKKLL
ncbi:MAG: RNA polymerase factor sigma-54 [Candidatus Desulfofervidaceae bacterium]|nr:RNA polymerase factor sigma-54 [Candidatus Desulfofervidaceae bacterium]MDL1969404.1 RNA polymerase factor sigma-54 [Candidatus Desulfofervidaceae bacterium]